MRVHHVALRTNDVAGLARFYTAVLGLAVLRRDDARCSVWLDAGGTIVMLERRGEDEPPIAKGSMELTCFAIHPQEHDLMCARLRDAGIEIESQTDYSVYFRDPDGRRVGVSSYPDKLGA